MHRSPAIAISILTVVVLLTGCALAGPRVVVDHGVIGEESEVATLVNIEVQLRNPRETPLELREMHYRVSLAGRHVYSGRRATALTLAPGETSLITVPAVIGFEHTDAIVLALAQGLSVSGSVEFVAPGRLALVMRDLGLPRPRARFSDRGDLALASPEEAE